MSAKTEQAKNCKMESQTVEAAVSVPSYWIVTASASALRDHASSGPPFFFGAKSWSGTPSGLAGSRGLLGEAAGGEPRGIEDLCGSAAAAVDLG